MILSVDPGEHVGVCLWSEDGVKLSNSIMQLDTFIAWADEQLDSQLSIIVYEDFLLRRNKANVQTGSRMQASQTIGVLKLLAKRHSAKLVRQQANILRIAGMHARVKLPTGHIPDDVSAFLHGFYYLESVGRIKPLAQR